MADVKPTPTQAENDRAAMGEHVTEHEPDGSEVDPSSPSEVAKQATKKHATAAPGAPYQTRHAAAAERKASS